MRFPQAVLWPVGVLLAAVALGAQERPSGRPTSRGFRVWEFPGHHLEDVAVCVIVTGAGRDYGVRGAADAVCHAIEQGCADELGVQGETHRDYATFRASVTAVRLPRLIQQLGQQLARPKLVGDSAALWEALATEFDSVDDAIYRGPRPAPSGTDVDGVLSEDDLRAFHRGRYRAHRIIVAFAGAVPFDEVAVAVEAAFPSLPAEANAPDDGRRTERTGVLRSANGMPTVVRAGVHLDALGGGAMAAGLVLTEMLHEPLATAARAHAGTLAGVEFIARHRAWRIESRLRGDAGSDLVGLGGSLLDAVAAVRGDCPGIELARAKVRKALAIDGDERLRDVALLTAAATPPDSGPVAVLAAVDDLTEERLRQFVDDEVSARRSWVVLARPSGGLPVWLLVFAGLVAVALIDVVRGFPVLRRRATPDSPPPAPRRHIEDLEREIYQYFDDEDRSAG